MLLEFLTVPNEQLWAPWRLSYIKENSEPTQQPRATAGLLPGADPACFLCRAVAESADQDNLVVHRGEHSFTILNRYPYNNGHLLVAPQRHLARLDSLSAEANLELVQQLSRLVQALERLMNAQGFNIGLNLGRAAGAGVPGHLHWHVVPRWVGDTNFMPIVASVDVIPQALESLWEMLVQEFAEPKGSGGSP